MSQRERSPAARACAVPMLFSIVVASCHEERDPGALAPQPVTQGYVGVQRCQACHGPILPPQIQPTYYDDWKGTAHGKTVDTVPSEQTIVGDGNGNGSSDFADGLDLGTTPQWQAYTQSGGAGADLAPRLALDATTGRYTMALGGRGFDVEKILGSGRHQQTYLTRIGNSLYVLPVVYRTGTGSWEPLVPENWYTWDDGNGNQRIDTGETITGALYPDTATSPLDLGRADDSWERNCAGCHVTGITTVQQNPAGELIVEYSEDGVGCEACHGPGRLHDVDLGGRSYPDRAIVQPSSFTAEQHRDLCESCHSQGTSAGTVGGQSLPYPWRQDDTPFVPGQPLADAFTKGPRVDAVHELQGTLTHRGLPNSTYGTWSHDCQDCHTAHDTDNLALVRQTVQTPNSGPQPVVFTQRSGTPGSGGLMGDGSDGSFTDICEVCHTQTLHFRNDPSTPQGGHFDGAACTTCHPHDGGFQRPESSGGLDCGGCHGYLAAALGAADYGHAVGDTTAQYPTLTSPLRCLSCHVDHDVFSPSIGGAGRGANQRTDIAVIPTTSAGFSDTDFIDSGTGGICLSCHATPLAKSFVRRDGSTTTPAIPFAAAQADQVNAYAAGMHGGLYQVTTQFRGTGTAEFRANCVKCHNDDLDPKSGVAGQTGAHPFGLHASGQSRMLAPLGSGGSTDPLEEQFCYRCHSSVGDPVGGTAKPTANRDWYDAQPMSARSEGIFAMASKPFGHAVGAQTGTHATVEGSAPNWNPAGNRHVECADCHNPHATGPSRPFDTSGTFAQPLAPGNLAAGTPMSGVWGVDVVWPAAWQTPNAATAFTRVERSTYTWQVCLKCHSGYAYGATPPAGATDQSLEFNPNNPSYHAVIGASVTTFVPNSSFVPPWTRTSAMSCSDCHSSDDKTDPQGPHGSARQGILAGRFDNSTGRQGTEGHLCFKCHDFDVYGRGGSAGPAATGFSGQGDNLHTYHMGENARCSSCHAAVPHGWQRRSMLVVTSDPAPYNNGSAALRAIDIPSWAASGNWRESSCDNVSCH